MKNNNTNTKLNITVFVCGAGTLALEILASRYMVPSFGTSIFIWGAVLSVTLFYLAVGYRWGGKVASRVKLRSRRLALHILYASAWIGLVAVYGPPLLLMGMKLGAVAGPILVALVLLGPPLILLSTSVPLAIGIIDIQQQGKIKASVIAGNLFALSTVGSIFGALLTAYWFLPQFGVGRSLFIVSLGLLVLAVPEFTNKSVHKTAVSLILILLFSKLVISPPELKSGLEFLDRRATPYGQVDVIADHRDNSRILLLDGASQNHVTGTTWDESRFEYINIVQSKALRMARRTVPEKDSFLGFELGSAKAPATLSQGPRKALILGLGAGILSKKLRQVGYQVECVELDPNVLEIAEDFFAFEQGVDSKVHISEARAFLTKTSNEGKEKWDLIVVDLAGGGIHPDHVYTREAYQTMQDLLKPDGVIMVNFVSYVAPPHNQVVMHSAATLASLFSDVYVYSVYPDAVKQGEMGQAFLFASSFPIKEKLFSENEAQRNLVDFDQSLRPLTDDWNPMSNWSVRANAEWHGNIVRWLGSGVLVPH